MNNERVVCVYLCINVVQMKTKEYAKLSIVGPEKLDVCCCAVLLMQPTDFNLSAFIHRQRNNARPMVNEQTVIKN